MDKLVGKKLLILGLVSVLLLTAVYGIARGDMAENENVLAQGEKHLYLVLNYNGPGVLRDYGKMKLVNTYEISLRGMQYYVKVDYMKNLGINGQIFDPLSDYPKIPSDLERETSKYYIVQFDGPVTEENLKDLGKIAKVIWYVPYNAYIVRLKFSPSEIERIKSVRWYGIYQPYFRVSPELQKLYLLNQVIPGKDGVPTIMESNEVPVRAIVWSDTLSIPRIFRDAKVMRHGGLEYITGLVPTDKIQDLANSDDVLYLERYIAPQLYDEKSDEIIGGEYPGYGSWVNSHLLMGDSVIVAVADTGLDTGSGGVVHPDLADRAIAFWSANGDDAHDGHGHGTHVAGIIAGTAATGERDEDGYLYGLGVAPHAHIVVEKIFSDSGGWLSPDYFILGSFAQSNGAVISSNSWGANTNGAYTADSQIYDMLVRDANPNINGSQELLFVFAAGNAGSGAQTVGSPATAKNVLTVGAVGNNRFGDSYQNVASFSSRGPASDGRLKPDVVAPGTWIASALSQRARPGWAWGNIDKWYEWCGGTSQATPHVSGAAAIFVQYYLGIYGDVPSPALIKAALINTAIDLNGTDSQDTIPNNNEGWGMVYLPNLIDPPYGEVFMDENRTLKTGETYSFNVTVTDSTHPLKITMVYTDREAAVNADPTLVNDLNLVVHGPNGEIYIGNNFANGWSVEGTASPDTRNNTENVYIKNPTPGNYTVEVIAQNVPMDAVPDTPDVDQDFAIVITGDVGNNLHYSSIRFSKNYYKPGDNLDVFVLDSYANTNHGDVDFVSARVRSITTGDVEGITLMETAANSGTFNASIPTEIGSANPGDGILQVSNMDEIHALYRDFLGSDRFAKTIIDGMPPQLVNVSVINIHSTSVTIYVECSETAKVTIIYGTPGNLSMRAYDGYDLKHYIRISGLTPYTVYYFDVYLEDRAGNSALYDNSSNHYKFRTAVPPDILIVEDTGGYYAYSTAFIAEELDDLGYDYDVWDTSTSGSPSSSVLGSYKVVFWNTGSDWSTNTLTDDDQANLVSYMDNGGNLILMGQDIIWGIGLADLFTKYFHISSVSQDAITGYTTTVYGIAGNPITGNYTSGLSLNSTYYLYIDELTNDGSAEVSDLFLDTNGKSIAVMVNNTTYKAVFLAFPYECLAVDEYPAAKNITYNMLRWMLAERDVFSLYTNAREWDIVGEEYTFPLLVQNKDPVAHSIKVYFYVENSTGVTVYSDNRSLNIDASGAAWVYFHWTPDYEDIYTVHAYVPNGTGEEVIFNNNISMTVFVRELKGTLRVVVVDSWVTDYSQYGSLDYIESHWYLFGNYKLIFDLQSLNKENINLDDIISSNPDVLMISNAWSKSYGWEFSDSEISALQIAAIMGYGIVATSGTFDSANAPHNMMLGHLFGINESIGGTWADFVTQYTVLNSSHPIFSGLSSSIPIKEEDACVGLVPDGATVLASTDNGSLTGKKGNLTEYRYGGGVTMYIPSIPEYMNSGEEGRHLLYNMLLYAWNNSHPPDHDLGVINVSTDRDWVKPGEQINISINLINAGTQDDQGNLKIYATYENGTTVEIDNVTVIISGGERIAHITSFVPEAEGKIRITAIISSPNDTIPDDNQAYGYVYSRDPQGTILVAGVDSLGSAFPDMMIWDDLKEHWYLYGNYTLEFDMGSLTGKNITYEDLVNSKADVLVISDAWRNIPDSGIWWEFSDSEIAAIKQYVSEGHGLIMTSGTLNTNNVPNNMKLAPLAGLNESASQSWSTTFSGVFNLNMSYNESSEIFRGMENPYTAGLYYTAYDWALNTSDPADLLANSTDNKAGIFFHKYSLGSVIYFSHLPEYAANANEEDKLLFYNAIVFTYRNSTQPVTDTSKPNVKIINPVDSEIVSGIMSVQVNATDNISWIPEVKVYLVNSTINVSFDTVHDYSLGVFKVAIDTTQYDDGNYTLSARAVDYYGNVNWTSINISIDNTAPVVSIIYPGDNEIIVGGRNVTVNWSAMDVHLDHIEVEIDGGAWINVGTASNHTFYNLSYGEHTVVVRVFDSLGNIGSAGVTFRIVVAPVPGPPENITFTVGIEYVNLSWDPPSDTAGLQIIEYRIYRATSSGAEVYIGNVSGDTTYFNDTTVHGGLTYYYYITAVNANGESAPSEEVSATPMAIPEFGWMAAPAVLAVLLISILRRIR